MNTLRIHRGTTSFRRCGPLAIMIAAALCAQQSGTQVTVQLVIRQPGGKTGMKQEEFSKQARPGPGKELRVWVVANRECDVSFAGFTQDGQLVYDSPETVRLPANVPKEFPASKTWTFEGSEHLAEIDAVIADPAAADYKDYASLVGKMNQPGTPELHIAQARALRKWIEGELLQSRATVYSIKETPVDIGGMIRGDLHGQDVVVPPQKTSIVRMSVY